MRSGAMAERQRKIKPAQKRALIAEAGDKCANPGCANWRVHIHHIKHWAVYKTHDTDHMIAVCPSCHDAIHHGRLHMTDDDLYRWKGLRRSDVVRAAHVYAEPGSDLKLLTGSIALATANDRAIVFSLSPNNNLSFRILDGDILQVSSRLHNQKGEEVLRVVENHVKVQKDKELHFEARPGRVRITAPANGTYVPAWVIPQMRTQEAGYAADGRVVALDLEVLKPGVIRVQGFWPSPTAAIVITKESLSFCTLGRAQPTSLVGEGEGSVLKFAGPVTGAMFGFK